MAFAQLQIVPDAGPQCVFGGATQKIDAICKNTGDKAADAEIRLRIYQSSSATVVRISEAPWKRLQVLPQQKVLESAQIGFPVVKAETRFLVQWLENSNHIIGTTEIFAYPTNLLSELKPLLGEGNMGVLDPNSLVKPLLKQNGVEYLDLEEVQLEEFSGKLAIIGPFQAQAQVREGLPEVIQRMAAKGVAVVWLQPPPNPKQGIKPSFYAVPEAKGSVVIVQPDLIARLSDSPKAQLNLVYFCKLALNPAPLSFPNATR